VSLIRTPAIESIGKKYNRMYVEAIVRQIPHSGAIARCKCDCGTTKEVPLTRVRNGDIKSCGCYKKENSRRKATKHGQRFTPEYAVWLQIVGRCTNKNNKGYHRYGGRGVIIDTSWRKFENFIADMGPRPSDKHSIERKNNDGNYEKDNCKWGTRGEQMSNTSRNVFVVHAGEIFHVSEWARRKDINPGTLHSRLKTLGWSVQEALNLKPNQRKRTCNVTT